MENQFKIILPSRSQNESFARVAVAAFASQLDPTVEEISDIKTAVSEAFTNCIVHAYKDTIGNVEILCKLTSGGELYIRIKDKGCGITDIKQAMQPLFTTDAGGERAGLGFAVMESFMDKLRVSSKVGKGTAITMIKRLQVKQ